MPNVHLADVFDALPDAAPLVAQPEPPVPDDSPIPPKLREALKWAAKNGVLELELPAWGKFKLRPDLVPSAGPTVGDLRNKFAPPPPTTVGGYDPEVLFAASPNPFVPPANETPLDPPKTAEQVAQKGS